MISGIAVTCNGTILLADHRNRNIKSVSPHGVLSVLSLRVSPTAITVLNTITVVAATQCKATQCNHLYMIEISNCKTLSLRDTVQIDYPIKAMTNYNGNLVVTCNSNPWSTKMICIDGKEMWSKSANASGQELSSKPYDITTAFINNTVTIVVTDIDKETLTLLEAENGSLIRIIDIHRKMPLGITTDNAGNAYIVYCGTNEIGVWLNAFKQCKIMLSKDKLGEFPCYIGYNGLNICLYVSYYSSSDKNNIIECFRI